MASVTTARVPAVGDGMASSARWVSSTERNADKNIQLNKLCRLSLFVLYFLISLSAACCVNDRGLSEQLQQQWRLLRVSR